jgi:hypothetical protein
MTDSGKVTTSRLSTAALREVENALKAYYDAVGSSDLSQSSQATYIDMANNFVRWARGDFEPGSRKEPYRIKKEKDKPGSQPAHAKPRTD